MAKLSADTLDMQNSGASALGLYTREEGISASGIGLSPVSSLSLALSPLIGSGSQKSLTIEPDTNNRYIRFTPTVDYAYAVFYQYRNSVGSSYNNSVTANTAVNKGYPLTINAGRQENYKVVIRGGARYFSAYGMTPALFIEYWFNNNSSPVYMREIITLGSSAASASLSTINVTMSSGNFWYINGQTQLTSIG